MEPPNEPTNFIENAILIHGNNYDYSNVRLIQPGSDQNMIISYYEIQTDNFQRRWRRR